jgi:ATP/maltotriose-dependent transcriptional regulator MalT
MNSTPESSPFYRFGLFEANPGAGELLKKGVRVKLQEQPFRQACRQQFHDEQQADDELAAALVLVNALLAQGKFADAKNELALAQPLASKSQNPFTQLQFNLASARSFLESDRPESARLQIEKTLQAARAHGYAGLEFEARLAFAQLEKKLGHAAAAQSQFAVLATSATAKGFGLVARKAAASRG